MGRTIRIVAVGVASMLASVCATAQATDISDIGVAAASLPAVRGQRLQLGPVPPPPRLCQPGSLIRGVDVSPRRMIAFSFDDGPWPTNTQAIMSTFEQRSSRATFFMIGNNVNIYPDIARDVATRGFEIGNHSQTHMYSPTTIAREVPIANETIRRATGVTPTLFRSPGLTQGAAIQSALAAQGMCNIFTTTDLGDWRTPRAPASVLCRRFTESLHSGEIVLLHDGGSHTETVQALPCMLDAAAAAGFMFVTVGELLNSGRAYTNRPPFAATTNESPSLPVATYE